MTDKSKLIDTILNDCVVNTVRQYRDDGSDPPKQNQTADNIMKGYSIVGGLFGSLDVGMVIEEMLVRKLIFEKADHNLYTDKLGYDVLDVGGWDNYVNQIAEDKQRERDNINASIRTAESVEKNQLRQNLILGLTCVTGIIVAIATVGQYNISVQQEKRNTRRELIQKLCPVCCSGRTHTQSCWIKTDTTHATKKTTNP